MRTIEEEKPFEEKENLENEAARLLRNLRDHGFAASNEQFEVALGHSHKEQASPIAIRAIEEE